MKSINSGAGVRHKRGKQRMEYYVPYTSSSSYIHTAPRVRQTVTMLEKDSKRRLCSERGMPSVHQACANTLSSNFGRGPRRMRCNANGFV